MKRSFHVWEECLSKRDEFKDLWVLFTGDGRQEGEADQWIKAFHNSLSLPQSWGCWSSLLWRRKSWAICKALNFQVHLHTNLHLRPWGIDYNCKSKNLDTSGWNEIPPKGSAFGGKPGVESLILWIERSQMKCFGHLNRMPPGHLPLKIV